MINNSLKCSLQRKAPLAPLASRHFAKRKTNYCLCGACAVHGVLYCDFCFDRFAFGRDPDNCDGHDRVDDAGYHPYPHDDGGSRGRDHDDCHGGSRRDHAGLGPTVTDEIDSFAGHPREREHLLVEEVVLCAVPYRHAACHNYHSEHPYYHHDDSTSLPCRRLFHAFDHCHDDNGLSPPLATGYDCFQSHAAGD
jgi:hypothetical protein